MTKKSNVVASILLTTTVLATSCSVYELERNKNLEEINTKVEQKLSNKVLEFNSLNKEFNILTDKYQDAQSTIDEQNDKISKTKKEISKLEKKLKSSKRHNVELENKIFILKQKVHELQLKKAKAIADANRIVSTSNTSSGIANKKSVNSAYSNWNHITVVATGYSLIDDASGSDGEPHTASGTMPRFGTIAVDTSIIPMGSRVYIPQFGMTFIAEDTGGAIKGNKIDIYFANGTQARQWGRQVIDIYVE